MISLTYTFAQYGEKTFHSFDSSRDWWECQRCSTVSSNNVVIGCGHPQADLLFIGEGPGDKEDRCGVPMVGPSGDLFNNFLSAVGLDRGDVFVDNTVGCCGREDKHVRSPTPSEVSNCSRRLNETIIELDPLLIVALGSLALKALAKESIQITKTRGDVLRALVPGVLVMVEYPLIATFHPEFIRRNPEDPKNKRQRERSLKMQSLKDYAYAVKIMKLANRLYGRTFNGEKEQKAHQPTEG